MSLRARAALLTVALWLAPSVASACAVCMGGQEEESATAFILMTIFMSGLPLALIGGIAWFVRRAYRQREARAEQRMIGLAPKLDPARSITREA